MPARFCIVVNEAFNQSADCGLPKGETLKAKACLRPKSLSMPYSFGHFFWQLAYSSKVGAKNTTAQKIVFCKYDSIKVQIKALRWRFFAPAEGLDLASNQGNCHTFARPITASGTLREYGLQRINVGFIRPSDRLLANDCSQ